MNGIKTVNYDKMLIIFYYIYIRNQIMLVHVFSFPWKDVAVADVCKAAAREQAGYTDDTVAEFDQMYAIAEQCGTNTNSKA